jgi:hypothetical protein
MPSMWARIFGFLAIEAFLLVTPMIFPTIPFEIGMAIYGGAFVLACVAVWLWWSPGAAHPKRRIPLVQIRDYCGSKGWNISGAGSRPLEVMDLADAIRQSVLYGEVAMWGRLDKWGDGSMGLTKDAPRTLVPNDHFKAFEIEIMSFVRAKDNADIFTYQMGADYNWTRGCYRDPILEMEDLKAWEKDARAQFKGRRDKAEAEAAAMRKEAGNADY